ncbi:MAG: aminopeptidase P family N-terminal domain-containing protein [Lachnospiraceae bacterium]|nr:aminopeptidase P family N-terminal domain-containing protein [Lachnospiraceae bacterium]
MTSINVRLAELREKMRRDGLDAYVVTSGDFHCSEYVSSHFRAVCFISGFTGSAGTVVVTGKKRCSGRTGGISFRPNANWPARNSSSCAWRSGECPRSRNI